MAPISQQLRYLRANPDRIRKIRPKICHYNEQPKRKEEREDGMTLIATGGTKFPSILYSSRVASTLYLSANPGGKITMSYTRLLLWYCS
jgi:hypothetical protein